MTLAPDAASVDAVGVDGVPVQPAQPGPEDAAAPRPLPRTGRPARAPQPGRLSPARALAGAAVSVSGVLLGIGSLLWISDDPSSGPGPVVAAPPPASQFATAPEAEEAPVDPVEPPVPSVAVPPVAARPVTSPAPAAPSLVVPVTVLNNSRYDGLADRAAARFRAGGWPVKATGNFRGRIPVTTVYYEAGLEASARELARRFDGIARVRPRFATLPARGLVVVVTREYAAS